ncbi:MAG: ABC transporter substrate-binding protein, partial [Giesbergeria sp.]|nr:ABC transporter substrate-binding protein [Giesbergeria sp.]
MLAPHVKTLAAACVLALAASAAFAQLRIGQTVGVTGTVAATVKESMQGAQLYLDHVNAKGGVGGEKIEIITLEGLAKFKTAEGLAKFKTATWRKHFGAQYLSTLRLSGRMRSAIASIPP